MSLTTDNLSVSNRIQMLNNDISDSERKVADFLLSNQHETISIPVITLATRIGVSEATVIRFCKKLGFSGYSELKLMLAREIGSTESVNGGGDTLNELTISKDDRQEDIPRKIIANAINGLKDTQDTIDMDEYKKAVLAILHARRVVLYGVANSYIVAEDALNKFMRLGICCSCYSDSHQQIISAASLSRRDVAIGISHSGLTIETVEAMRVAKEAGATTICISNQFKSPIIEVSDIKLLTAAHETSFTSETMVSRISQLAIIDMLYCGIIVEDYDHYSKQISRMNEIVINKSY